MDTIVHGMVTPSGGVRFPVYMPVLMGQRLLMDIMLALLMVLILMIFNLSR